MIQQPLAQRTLGWLHLHTAAALALTLEVARLQGEAAAAAAIRQLLQPAAPPCLQDQLRCHLQTIAQWHLHLIEPLHAGLYECGGAGAEELAMLRLLTPLAKLFSAKEAVAVVSEGEPRQRSSALPLGLAALQPTATMPQPYAAAAATCRRH